MSPAIRNLKLTIEYDGTGFDGWQTQPSKKTVQDLIEDALSRVLRDEVKIIGAGRTDSGVHARGQVANFKTVSDISLGKLRWSVNAVLPNSVAIRLVKEASDDFHARYDAKLRVYSYNIWNDGYLSPFYDRFSWWVSRPLDLDPIRSAAALFIGSIDLAAFTPEREKNTERNIAKVEVEPISGFGGKMLRILVAADSFPYNFVRFLAGTLVDTGLRKTTPEAVERVLASKKFDNTFTKAPAKGLVLESVEY